MTTRPLDRGTSFLGAAGGRRVARQREEHVVESRGVHGEPGDRASLRVDVVEQGTHVRRGAVGRQPDQQPGRFGVRDPGAEPSGRFPVRVGVDHGQVQPLVGEARLEAGRRAFGDDPPAVDDRDPVGELVGLL